jgi:hypothetical protein
VQTGIRESFSDPENYFFFDASIRSKRFASQDKTLRAFFVRRSSRQKKSRCDHCETFRKSALDRRAGKLTARLPIPPFRTVVAAFSFSDFPCARRRGDYCERVAFKTSQACATFN